MGSARRASAGISAIGLSIGLLAGACQLLGERPLIAPEPDPELVQRGGLLFMSPQLSGDGSRSCASCHPGGGSDGGVYLKDVPVPPGTPGARVTPGLRGLWQTPPYYWDGSVSSLDEAIARMLEVEMRGGQADGRDLAALEAYLLSIPPFDRGRVESDGTPIEPVTMSTRRGFAFFKQAKCSLCHPPPLFTRGMRFDVGTGLKLQPPSLRGVASFAPYGHDGRWASLEETVRAMLAERRVEYSEQDLSDLLSYLELL